MADNWLLRVQQQARLLGEARMLREDDPLTVEVMQEITARFRSALKALEKSETWAARSIGCAPSTLSQLLSGIYKGDSEQWMRKIDKWIDQQLSTLKTARPEGYLKLSTAEAILGAAKMANSTKGIVVVHGPAGCGKTTGARFVASEYPGAVYIDVTECNKGRTGLLDALAREAVKGHQLKLTVAQREQVIIEAMKDYNRMIIVDEVHTLVTGRAREEQSLHMLRRIHDQTGCPMLWFATDELQQYLEKGTGIRQGVDQLYGRITWWLDLTSPALNNTGPGLHTLNDIRQLVEHRKMRITPDGEAELHAMANTRGLGGLHTIDRVLRLLAVFSAGKVLTAELIRDLQRSRCGDAMATRVEKRVSERRIARTA